MKDCSLWLAGEAMAELCREFGISRKTGYKIFDRYQECGMQGLTDRSRRPYRYANQLPFQVENYILNVKHEHPSWGARKIRERLLRRFSEIPLPAKSTIHAVLDRHGLVEQRGRRRRRAQGTPLSLGQRPNELCRTSIGDWQARTRLCNRRARPPARPTTAHVRKPRSTPSTQLDDKFRPDSSVPCTPAHACRRSPSSLESDRPSGPPGTDFFFGANLRELLCFPVTWAIDLRCHIERGP